MALAIGLVDLQTMHLLSLLKGEMANFTLGNVWKGRRGTKNKRRRHGFAHAIKCACGGCLTASASVLQQPSLVVSKRQINA